MKSFLKACIPDDDIWNHLELQRKIIHSDTIWYCRNIFNNNVSKAYIVTVLETIWNCREKFENNVSKACILTPDCCWNGLKLQKKWMKTMSLMHAFWRYFKRFGTAGESENKDGKLYIVTVLETFWNCREKFENNVLTHAFWRRTLVETGWNCRKNENNVT